MQQRIVRAKQKIARARIPFRTPDAGQLHTRLAAVLLVVYLTFTEGYASSAGENLLRADLSDEAIRLGRILHQLLPQEREVAGLLALMLLTDARRAARTDPDGVPISIEDQDRGRWDTAMIAEGRVLLTDALTGSALGPYTVQAGIAALHDEAQDVATTNWPRIVALYDVLLQLTGSPVIELNRAVAVAMQDGPAAGLTLIDQLAQRPELRNYHPLFSARAELLTRLGRRDEAAETYRTALQLVGNQPEHTYLTRRLDALKNGGANI
jgi:RNA polymerase sigma-70 factor, ECF subfamily